MLTSIASISFSETGVRFGWREAFPPTALFPGAAGTSDLDMEIMRVSLFVDPCWAWDAETVCGKLGLSKSISYRCWVNKKLFELQRKPILKFDASKYNNDSISTLKRERCAWTCFNTWLGLWLATPWHVNKGRDTKKTMKWEKMTKEFPNWDYWYASSNSRKSFKSPLKAPHNEQLLFFLGQENLSNNWPILFEIYRINQLSASMEPV